MPCKTRTTANEDVAWLKSKKKSTHLENDVFVLCNHNNTGNYRVCLPFPEFETCLVPSVCGKIAAADF
jgi:hypothetical protein